MHLTSALLGGLLLGMFMAISVGPTLFAVLRYSLNHSYKAGLAFVLGVSISDVIFVTVANVATPWLQWLHQFARPLAYSASALLIVAGLYGAIKKQKPKKDTEQILKVSNAQYFKILMSGFLINTLNPALIFQWIVAATGMAAETGAYRFVFFGSCLGLVLGIDVLKVFLADKIRRRLTIRRIMLLQKISALMIFAFGVGLLVLTIMNVELQPPNASQSGDKIYPTSTALNVVKA
ncbi:MAG TPA: LysE family transporter [Flavipsychrobacter sp.]|nr:LysE family transporter [Flavipsychrobacter sp.]